MTVEENFRLGAFVARTAPRSRAGWSGSSPTSPSSRSAAANCPATLSGGQLQMLCIGRGLMSEPKMMLLDEPSAALAPQVMLDIFRIIDRICRTGMTLLMVEQNVRMALLLASTAMSSRTA